MTKTHNATVKMIKYEEPTIHANNEKLIEEFNFEQGCEHALQDKQVSPQNLPRAYYQTLSFSYKPAAFHLSDGDNNGPVSVPTLVHTDVAKPSLCLEKWNFLHGKSKRHTQISFGISSRTVGSSSLTTDSWYS